MYLSQKLFVFVKMIPFLEACRPETLVELAHYFLLMRYGEGDAVIKQGDVPWSILRASQFHEFVVEMVDMVTFGPFAFIPGTVQVQPVETRSVARRLVEIVNKSPTTVSEDLAGPDVIAFGDVAEAVWSLRPCT